MTDFDCWNWDLEVFSQLFKWRYALKCWRIKLKYIHGLKAQILHQRASPNASIFLQSKFKSEVDHYIWLLSYGSVSSFEKDHIYGIVFLLFFNLRFNENSLVDLFTEYHPLLEEYELSTGWLPGRMKDVSDQEWSVFSKNAFAVFPWMCLHMVGSQYFKKFNKQVQKLFWY